MKRIDGHAGLVLVILLLWMLTCAALDAMPSASGSLTLASGATSPTESMIDPNIAFVDPCDERIADLERRVKELEARPTLRVGDDLPVTCHQAGDIMWCDDLLSGITFGTDTTLNLHPRGSYLMVKP